MTSHVTKEGLDTFLELLRTDIIRLSDERMSMSDIKFAKSYKVSLANVLKHMGQCPYKPIQKSRSKLVVLDKATVNKMRAEGWKDKEIAKEFQTSNCQIWLQCGSRKDNGFVRGEQSVKQEDDRLERGLNTVSWENPKEGNEYWRGQSEIIEPGEGPIAALHELKRGW